MYSSSCFSSIFELETALVSSYGKNLIGIIFIDDGFGRKGGYEEIKLPSNTVALCKADGTFSQDGFEFMAGPMRSELAIVLIVNTPKRKHSGVESYELGEIAAIHATKLEKNSDSRFDLVFTDDDISRMAGSKEADLKFKQYWGKKVLEPIPILTY